MNDQLKNYQTAETLGHSQLELILQVYDGALTALKKALSAYEVEQLDSGYNELEKAKRFVTHLYTTLNLEAGGEVAANLARLYAFVIGEINSVQATKNTEQLTKVRMVLKNIRDGWAGLKEQVETDQGDQAEGSNVTPQPFMASV